MSRKKTIFIISPYPFGTAPSQRFRYEQYIQQLERCEYSVEFFPFINQKDWKILYQKGKYLSKTFVMLSGIWKRFLLLFKIKKADYVFIHREMAQFGPPIFEWITSKMLGVKYIYDFDDAIWLPNFSDSNAKFQWIKCYWKVPSCIKWAHQVSVGNEYLAEYAKKYNPNVVVIPTTIDMENHHNRTIDYTAEKIVIGWTGTLTTMNYIKDILPALQQLEDEFDFDFLVISNKQPDFQLKSLVYKEWNKETEIEDLSKMNIGVMPLRDDQWSKGKCGFKALQYMSLGIPCVISPVGVNTEIVQNEVNGFLASDENEFYLALKQLISDKELRMKIGLKGQATIRNRYSTSVNFEKYLQLFN